MSMSSGVYEATIENGNFCDNQQLPMCFLGGLV